MAYSEPLAERIRERLATVPNVEERAMMGGIVYMVDGKMCIGIIKDEMMCRIAHELYEESLEKQGCHPMEFTGRAMPGYVLIDESGMKSEADFNYWIGLALAFNPFAKAAKKRKAKE
ncbi:MAG: TfoX/Sxy family protein [Bacteroidota bacterium]